MVERRAAVPGSTGGFLAIFGDSVAAGMGVRGERYVDILAGAWGLHLLDHSGTAKPISESLSDARGITDPPKIAIIAHGITEAIIRPSTDSTRYLPPRWRKEGWMDPRPYFSRRLSRRILQQAESGLRWRVRNALLLLGKTRQIMGADKYFASLRELTQVLLSQGCEVILLGPPELDERYFPGSTSELDRYWALSENMGLLRVRLTGCLQKWDDYCADHFHPNDAGHAAIAMTILSAYGAYSAPELPGKVT